MKVTNQTIFLIAYCLLYWLFGFSQKLNKEVKPLYEVLKNAEKQYHVTFTYANKIIEGVSVIPYPKNLNQQDAIAYLEKSTGLTFTHLTKKNILINIPINNQNLCGYLFNAQTKTYIEGAHISILNTNIHTTSNSLGYFSFDKLTDSQIIKISHLSFPTMYVNATDFIINNHCLTIKLNEKIEKLNEVILNNYLTSGISINKNNSIEINTQDFGILPGLIEPDVLNQIQAIPGISSINETISNINIRGGTNDQNLLLWDGIKMYHSGHFFGLISAFNPYLTNNVTIIKNGTSAQFNDGVSGTIDIKSIDKISDQAFGGAGFNLLSSDAFAQIPISKKMALQVSGRRALTDIVNTPTFEQYFKRAFQDTKISESLNENIKTNSNFNFFDYSIKFLYNINKKNSVRVSYLNVDNKLHFNETLTSENTSASKTSELEQKNTAIGVQINTQWNSKFKSLFHTYYTKYTINAGNFSVLNDQRLLQTNEVLETGVKLNTFYTLNSTIKLLNGYHYYELGVTNKEDVNIPIFVRTIKNVIRNHSLYSELSYTSNNNSTFFTGGIRLNYIEKFGNFIVEPRVNALHKFNSNFAFKIAGEFKSQNATQIIDLQEDFLGVEKKRWTLANNSNIPIIQSKQASAGFNYKKNNFIIDIEAFYKYVNGITSSTQGFQNQNQFIKTSGSYTIKGLEFLINKKTSNFSTWLGYSFNKNNYTFTQLTPKVFPNNTDIRHSISFGNTYTYKNFNFAIGINYRTGKPHTTPVENNPITFNQITNVINYNTPNAERLSDYFRADFSSTYKFKINTKINAMAGISILNILNIKNTLNTYYTINSNNTLNTINNTSIATTPNFTFRISF